MHTYMHTIVYSVNVVKGTGAIVYKGVLAAAGCSSDFFRPLSPYVDKPLKSVSHGQCDARPTVTFLAVGHHRI